MSVDPRIHAKPTTDELVADKAGADDAENGKKHLQKSVPSDGQDLSEIKQQFDQFAQERCEEIMKSKGVEPRLKSQYDFLVRANNQDIDPS